MKLTKENIQNLRDQLCEYQQDYNGCANPECDTCDKIRIKAWQLEAFIELHDSFEYFKSLDKKAP